MKVTRKEIIEILNEVEYMGLPKWDNDGVGGLFIGWSRDRSDYHKLFEQDAARIAAEQKALLDAADDEIAGRIAKQLIAELGLECTGSAGVLRDDAIRMLDDAEAYRLAFTGEKDQAKVRREQERIRPLVFAKLKLRDRDLVEKDHKALVREAGDQVMKRHREAFEKLAEIESREDQRN
jgi:hypothetical protein